MKIFSPKFSLILPSLVDNIDHYQLKIIFSAHCNHFGVDFKNKKLTLKKCDIVKAIGFGFGEDL